MRITDAAGVELAAEFGHGVFVPDVVRIDVEVFLE